MIRGLVRGVLLVIVVVAIAAFVIGYRWADTDATVEREPVVGTTGDRTDGTVDVDSAREIGAEVGERVADGTNEAQRLATDAGITARIKSKMALDEIVEAADLDVDTNNGMVTVSGTVASAAERERALQLARETQGVTSVVDRLSVR
jgi:hyperosmotically inducible protein